MVKVTLGLNSGLDMAGGAINNSGAIDVNGNLRMGTGGGYLWTANDTGLVALYGGGSPTTGAGIFGHRAFKRKSQSYYF